MNRKRSLDLLLSLMTSVICAVALADEADTQAQMQFFENEVRPLLVEKCFTCHSEEKQKGGLRLDSLASILEGGESGSAIEPGNADASLLIEAINYDSYEMPPSEKMTDRQIAVLTRWVSSGAFWPDADLGDAPRTPRELFSSEDRQWWAFQPVSNPIPPTDSDSTWAINSIDAFTLAAMRQQELEPAPEADKLVLVRRLYFDVIGLPPTADQIDAFINDAADDAYERLVDHLLDSPGYGERAARLWLDLVRYADSDGYRADGFRPNAWRYRDYVIESFNQDKPYDRFVQEQIAADELFPDDASAAVGLGYLRHWVYEWNIRDAEGQWKTILEDLTDTTADVFMGLGLQCAKCHNHKFDPLLQKDYYRLQAFFAPLIPCEQIVAPESDRAAYATKLAAWSEQTKSIQEQIALIEVPYRQVLKDKAINRFPEPIQSIARKPAAEQSPYEAQIAYLIQRQVDAEYETIESSMKPEDKEKTLALKRQLLAHQDLKPSELATAMTVKDVAAVAPPSFIAKRPDELIEPGFPTILESEPAKIDSISSLKNSTGRRATLARWLTNEDNPLTTRVIVNRLWQSHFGRGLATNASDFGKLGEPPSHPELLDWLARRFVNDGWSLKSLHRLILNSATYRQATKHPQFAAMQTIDPSNRYYWRGNTKRLDAEQIRDAILMVTGQLHQRTGGPSVLADGTARTIYTRVLRNSPDELLDSFDLPLFFSSNSSRNTTTTPVQSLMLINSNRMLGYANQLATTIANDSDETSEQVNSAWRRVYGRSPTENELQSSLDFIASQFEQVSALQGEQPNDFIETAKLPYRDGQAIRFSPEDAEFELSVPHIDRLNTNDFTVETFFQLRSIDTGSNVRTLAAKWSGDTAQAGWAFGITGIGSRRKPQTLVLQLIDERRNENNDLVLTENALFSDHRVEINKPYYAAVSVKYATAEQPGSVRFYLKDLSNDDEPLLNATVEHSVVGGVNNKLPLTFGGLSGKNRRAFDGLIDDVRLAGSALNVEQLLYSAERKVESAIGFWQFESDPGVVENSISSDLQVEAKGKSIVRLEPIQTALVDFCHALLNSNEFLYVQ